MTTLPTRDGHAPPAGPDAADLTQDFSGFEPTAQRDDGAGTVVCPPAAAPAEAGGAGCDRSLDDRFWIGAELARGAMGVVYRGWDASLARPVAVKFLLDAHLGRADLRRRFLDEARVTARLQHPGIVSVHAIGETPDGRPYYVMRLVEGQTFAQLLRAGGDPAADRPRLLRLFETVCSAVAYAHSRGVIHRDLKPANVMTEEFGGVKVMDWGVAKVRGRGPDPAGPPAGDPEGSGTRHGLVLGTPSFMAPELAGGRADRADERTDVFGLGGILTALLTGHPPYTGATAAEVQRMAGAADLGPAFDRLARCGAEPELVALCRRCLAPDPADRPPTAAALGREVAEFLDAGLRRAERDLVRFFELSPDLFCIAGLDGYFRRVNGNFTRVLGYTTAELLSRPLLDFVHPDDAARTRAEMTKLSQGLPCVCCRNRYRDTGGNYRWFEWTAKSIPEEGIIFAVARDVTDQIRLEEQLQSYQDE